VSQDRRIPNVSPVAWDLTMPMRNHERGNVADDFD